MFPRSLSARVLLVAAGAAFIGFACAVAMVRVLAWRTQTAMGAALRAWATEAELVKCEASSASFSAPMPNGTRAFAYDALTRTSANPAAPLLALSVDRVPQVTGEVRTAGKRALRGMMVVLRARRGGPCSLIAISWPTRFRESDPALIPAAVLAFATAAMTALGFLLVVRPLVQRVEGLRRAAEAVGDAEYPAAEAPGALDELTRIRAALDRAHARISQSNARVSERLRTLQEHLTNVAHDLRTPLASLQAHVEEALDAEAHADSRESLQRALADCVYLAGLSENLRLASQLQEGWDPARAGVLDLAPTVERVAGRLLHYARRRGISLEFAVPETPVPVRCDAFACEQALGNVIENAVTHLSAGGRIGVVLDLRAERFALTVVDDGPGVAPAELAQLGERTFRSDEARARDPRGSGLGLAIAKAVCDRCGWTLEFSRAREGGLRVDIRGQLSDAPAPSQAS